MLSEITTFLKVNRKTVLIGVGIVAAWIAALVFWRLNHPSQELPHRICLLNYPFLIWPIVVSDIIIGLSYYLIPITLANYVRDRKDHEHMPKWVVGAFMAFIFFCGTGHFVEAITVFVPVYYLMATVYGLTAIVSIITAIKIPAAYREMSGRPSRQELEETINNLKNASESLHAVGTGLHDQFIDEITRVNTLIDRSINRLDYLQGMMVINTNKTPEEGEFSKQNSKVGQD